MFILLSPPQGNIACDHIWDYLETKAFVPQFNSTTCLVFDEEMFEHGSIATDAEEKSKEFCGEKRKVSILIFSYPINYLL